VKAEVPAHAQRMDSLLAADREFVFCRKSKGGRVYNGGRGAGREAGGPVGSGAAQAGMHGEGPTQGLGARARAKRTSNMLTMSVILDMSKLSGWLKACAFCRVEGRACDAGRGAGREAGGRGVVAAQAGMQGEGARVKAWGAGHARSARRTWSAWS
jgi:hypothetical protein